MIDPALKEVFAKAYITKATAEKAPRFLERNLRRILDRHEQLSRGILNASTPVQEIDENQGRVLEWELPTNAQVGAYAQDMREGPNLRIETLLLRPKTDRRRGLGDIKYPQSVSERGDVEGDVFINDIRLHCQVRLWIYHTGKAKETLHRSLVRAEIVEHRNPESEPVFQVRLVTPFTIVENELSIDQGLALDDVPKPAVTGSYTVEIAIQCSFAHAATRLLEIIAGGTQCSRQVNRRDITIKAVWGDPDSQGLPHLQRPEDELWKLRLGNSELAYGMEAVMHWERKKGYNLSRVMRENAACQLPTPDGSHGSISGQASKRHSGDMSVQYRIRTNWSTRSVHADNLRCIFCRSKAAQPSHQRLYLHYTTSHDQYDIEVEEDEANTNCKIFRLTTADDTLNASSREFQSQAPSILFDIRSHLLAKGNSPWRIDERRHGQDNRVVKPALKGAAPLLQPLKLSRKRTKDIPAEDVPELPVPKRRRHEVPCVPDVSFYRNSSKRVLEQGTYVSDSEDDLDNTWLSQSQRRDLIDLGADNALLELEELFHKDFDLERPSSDLATRDLMIRFTRRHKTTLARPGLRERFKAKLEQLRARNIISTADLEYCWQLLPAQAQSSNADPHESSDQATPDQQYGHLPFGKRRVTCRRAKSNTRIKPHLSSVSQYVGKAHKTLDSTQIRAHHIAPIEVVRILDKKLEYTRSADLIVLRNGDKADVLTDEKDWLEALQRAEQRGGELVFELHTDDSYMQLLDQLKSHVDDGTSQSALGRGGKREKVMRQQACVCGEVVQGNRSMICCGNTRCSRQFHMACVKVEKRSLEWRCIGCRTDNQ